MNNKNSNIRTMEFIAVDFFGSPVYKCLETGQLWKDLGDGEYPQLHSCDDLDGDPGWAIRPDLEIRFKTKYEKDPYEFNYMMLSRLKSDCDYFLGYGNRCEKRLYHGNPKLQIEAMLILWESFPQDKKPEWLTREEIMAYEKAMIG
jgi:hypothetical protein